LLDDFTFFFPPSFGIQGFPTTRSIGAAGSSLDSVKSLAQGRSRLCTPSPPQRAISGLQENLMDPASRFFEVKCREILFFSSLPCFPPPSTLNRRQRAPCRPIPLRTSLRGFAFGKRDVFSNIGGPFRFLLTSIFDSPLLGHFLDRSFCARIRCPPSGYIDHMIRALFVTSFCNFCSSVSGISGLGQILRIRLRSRLVLNGEY